MIVWFESLPAILSAIVIVGGFLLLTLAVGWITTRVLPHEVRLEHNDLAGFILAVIGVVYAVLLAFVAVSVWERFTQAEARSYTEAASLATVYRDVDVFPQAPAIRADLREYVGLVISDEWPAMNHGGQSEDANRLIEKIDRTVRSLPVHTLDQEDVHAQMLSAIDLALADRDTRLSMDSTGISGVLWVVLIIGALVTVSFTYLFGFRDRAIGWVMNGSLGLLIGLVLYLTVALDYPFRGAIIVEPEAFEKALETFKVIAS